MKVIDNFLPDDEHKLIHDVVIGNSQDFPIHIITGVSQDPDIKDQGLDWYGIHMVYNQGRVSGFYNIVDQFFRKRLSVESWVRIKVNFYGNTPQIHEHGVHTDYPFDNTAAVYSINTCDGFTRFADGTRVDSVANRIVIFDGKEVEHNSTTCTNTVGRWNLNFNFKTS